MLDTAIPAPARAEQDLGPLAWVLDELRKSMDAAVKSLRRYVRESDATVGTAGFSAPDMTHLETARQQLHQCTGALDMINQPSPAHMLRAMENAVQRFVDQPALCTDESVSKIERASFAAADYLEAVLAGKPVSAVGLFPQYRDVQGVAGSDRVHPADLWTLPWQWIAPSDLAPATPLDYAPAVRSRLDQAVLKIVKTGDATAAIELRGISLGFAAAHAETPQKAFWSISAAYFEALSLGLVPSDLYAKRIASRVLTQYAALVRGDALPSDRLAQDMLFFCARAVPPEPARAPTLVAVREAYGLADTVSVDYEERRFGRFDPALLAQARKRIAAATETWSALAGGDTQKFKAALDQFGMVGESLTKLHPDSAVLAQALNRAVEATVRSGTAPPAPLAMEVATSVLYLEAAYDELDQADADMHARATLLAGRLERVSQGGQPEPLESWMEELYHRVSDRQTMGSVVEELRKTLGDVEQALDQFFRSPREKVPLGKVTAQLSQMRGVLSVLGLDQASHAVMRMRETVDGYMVDELDDAAARAGSFDRLGSSLGALGFLIDMLGYQRALAKKLFVYDEEQGVFRLLMGRQATPAAASPSPAPEPAQAALAASPMEAPSVPDFVAAPMAAAAQAFADLPSLPALPTAAPTPAAPAPAPQEHPSTQDLLAAGEPLPVIAMTVTDPAQGRGRIVQITAPPPSPGATPVEGDEEDDELREIFLEEAREVVQTGLAAVESLVSEPADLTQQTTLRRAFHTLKGSSRMVGLREFGDAAWSLEQLLNAWLAEQKPAGHDLLELSDDALRAFGRWTDDIAAGTDGGWRAQAFRVPADALRLEKRSMPLRVPGAEETAASAPVPLAEPVPLPEALSAAEPAQAAAAQQPPAATHEPAPAEFADSVLEPRGPSSEFGEVDFEDTTHFDGHDFGHESLLPKESEPAPLLDTTWTAPAHSSGGVIDISVPAALEAPVTPEEALAYFDLPEPATAEPAPAPAEAAFEAVDLPGAADEAASTLPPEFVSTLVPEEAPTPAATEPDATHATEHAAAPASEAAPEPSLEPAPEPTVEAAAEPVEEPALPVVEPAPLEEPVQELFDAATDDGAIDVQEPAQDSAAAADLDDNVKVIGSLRIGIPLYNVYLNEADEWSRRLLTELNEWALELPQPVADSTVGLAHSLAGSSATVGFDALSHLARTLEHALGHVQLVGPGGPQQAQVFVDAAEDIRRLLHQFAAGFLKEANPAIQEALEEILQAEAAPSGAAALQDLHDTETADPALAFFDLPGEGHGEVPAAGPVASVAQAAATAPLLEAVDTDLRDAADADAFERDRRIDEAMAIAVATGSDFDDDIDVIDVIDPDLFPIFEEEATELLPQLSGALRQWWARSENGSARNEVLRALHTLKGSARLAGALRLGELAHRLESSIERLGSEGVQAGQIEPLLTHFDALQADLDVLRAVHLQGQSGPVNLHAPHVAADAAQPAAEGDTAAPAKTAVPVPTSTLLHVPRPMANQSVRVRSQLLDRLVNQSGEVMITRSRLEARLGQLRGSLDDLTGNLERLRHHLRDIEVQAESQMQSRLAQAKDTAGFDPLEFDRFTRVQELTRMMAESVNDVATVQRTLQRTIEGTEDDLIAQGRQARELQRDLLRTRMVEFEGISERLYGVVRQASKDSGRQVKLDITGGSIEMDRGVLDRMTPAFEHLLRNAIAHGIEDAETRGAAGKPAAGTITVGLQHEANDIAVTFQDDGRGLDLPRIQAKALSLGLLSSGKPLEGSEAADLIFLPGFSTAGQVTELSGRGIGMDVVRTEVQALGGRIETTTQPGRGTQFKIVLPLTTAVTQVVMLRAGELSIGVPTNLVEVVRRVPAAELAQTYASESFAYGGEQVPFYWAGALLQSSAASQETHEKHGTVIVMRSAAQRVALHVDEVLGNQEVVVKNLGPQLSRLPGLAGMSVLASGAVVLIYNPVALATVFGAQARQFQQDAALRGGDGGVSAATPAVAEIPLVLVVDDSITVRRVTQRLLKREGYRVTLAADGLQALERLQEERPAIVLSDIEMPRMDGFDLARNIRADEALKTLPIIMITSRMAEKHREHARELGVNHYLGKPYSEEELLSLVRRYTAVEVPV